MARHHPRLPLWRACGAGLAVFAIIVQVSLSGLLSGLLAVQPAGAAGADGFSIVCTHDGAALADDGDAGRASSGSGNSGSGEHHCPACACPQHGGLIGPPTAVGFVWTVTASAAVPIVAPQVCAVHGSNSPYASRAPPRRI